MESIWSFNLFASDILETESVFGIQVEAIYQIKWKCLYFSTGYVHVSCDTTVGDRFVHFEILFFLLSTVPKLRITCPSYVARRLIALFCYLLSRARVIRVIRTSLPVIVALVIHYLLLHGGLFRILNLYIKFVAKFKLCKNTRTNSSK